MTLETLVAEPWPDWGLIDSGDGRKLERYGKIVVERPEPQAMWSPARADWDPHATFVPGSDEDGGGRWVHHRTVPAGWELSRGPVQATVQWHVSEADACVAWLREWLR